MQSTTNKAVAVFAICLGLASSADITFASEKNCTGTALYGTRNETAIPCYNLTGYDEVKSIITDNVTEGQKFKFYSDESCKEVMHSVSDNTCLTLHQDKHVRSFELVHPTIEKRNGTVRMTPYKDLPQTDPYNIDLSFTTGFLAVGALAVASGGLSLFSAVQGCTGLDATDPLPIAACIAGPLATILAFATAGLKVRVGNTVNQDIEMATGVINTLRRRRDINEALFDYMATQMNRTKTQSTHVGFMERNMTDGEVQRSPLHEIQSPDGRNWHMAAFYNREHRNVVHHLRPATPAYGENILDRRDPPVGYNNVRWTTNGFDFTTCDGAYSGDPTWTQDDSAQNYNTAYDQLTCDVTAAALSGAGEVVADMYNAQSVWQGSVNIFPFLEGEGVTPACIDANSPLAPSINQGCIVP